MSNYTINILIQVLQLDYIAFVKKSKKPMSMPSDRY